MMKPHFRICWKIFNKRTWIWVIGKKPWESSGQNVLTFFNQIPMSTQTPSIHAQGKFSLHQEDFKNLKRLYEQALDYFTNTQRGHVLISLAGWYFFRDQLTEAMQHLQDSEALLDSNPSLFWSNVWIIKD